MKELVVISGKGGTGKTSITAALASLAKNFVLADCDVDAADLHLVTKPDIKQTTDFSGGRIAKVDTEKCIGCGKCEKLCRFDAISLTGPANSLIEKTYQVDPISCEGCKVCVQFCPAEAIEFNEEINGQWFISETKFAPMVHAKLGIAQENSGKLVTLIRQNAKELAEKNGRDLIIVDGSPGIGCPVIASITGANLLLIVTEPTLSGIHDLERVAKLAGSFQIKSLVCINKFDINPEMAERISEIADSMGLKVVAKLPYDDAFTKAQIEGKTLVEYADNSLTEEIKNMWGKISSDL